MRAAGHRPVVVTVVGARPQFVKAAPLSRALRRRVRQVLVHTGQHYDREMSQAFFEALDIPAPDHHLGIGSGSHGAMTGRMLEALEAVLLQVRPAPRPRPGGHELDAGRRAGRGQAPHPRRATWRPACAASIPACPKRSTAEWPITCRACSSAPRRPRSEPGRARASAAACTGWGT